MSEEPNHGHNPQIARMQSGLWEAEVLERPDWHAHAACHGETAVFFGARGESSAWHQAKKICHGTDEQAGCPVRLQCLEYALSTRQAFGVWGGLSERERRRVRRKRRAA